MEKVWFKLRQTDHSPPPEVIILLGDGDDSKGTICLGHFISELMHLDFPLNRGSILPFPRQMTVYRSSVLNFTWDDSKTSAPGINLAAGAPILAAVGVTARASLQTAFMRTTCNHESYDRLDTYTVHPTKDYVERCLERDEIKEHIKRKPTWSLFLITGIKVARAGKRETRQAKDTLVDIGPDLDVPMLATMRATTNMYLAESQGSSGDHVEDFIWAVRLAKVHKGLLMRDWSISAYTKKATFRGGDSDVDIEGVLRNEEVDKFQVVDDTDLGEAIVLDDVYFEKE